MPDFSAKITIELEAELEFTGESLKEATDWLENCAKLENLKELGGGYWPKEQVRIHRIEENSSDKK